MIGVDYLYHYIGSSEMIVSYFYLAVLKSELGNISNIGSFGIAGLSETYKNALELHSPNF